MYECLDLAKTARVLLAEGMDLQVHGGPPLACVY